ncbi:MAG: ABC transporter ATP-binding protein, partial [Angelakisella sp.]
WRVPMRSTKTLRVYGTIAYCTERSTKGSTAVECWYLIQAAKGGEAVLTFQNVSKAYGKQAVLADISLRVLPGECVGLCGENSAGKTTLLSIAAGLVKADSGKVLLSGTAALVPQQDTLPDYLTVTQCLALFYAAHHRATGELFAPDSTELLLGLGDYRRQQLKKLSGGRRRRLSICLALVGQPALLLLDEPFAGLDIAARQELARTLTELKHAGRGVLLSAHELPEILACCDRVVVLRDRQIRAEISLDRQQSSDGALSQQIVEAITGEPPQSVMERNF